MKYIFTTKDNNEAAIIMHAIDLYSELLNIDNKIRRFHKDNDIDDPRVETLLMELVSSIGWVREL